MSKPSEWIKATRSTNDNACVEMRRHDDRIEVRDTKQGESGPILSFTTSEWTAWLDGAKGGEFDHLS